MVQPPWFQNMEEKFDKEELIGALVTFELETRIEEYEDR